MITSRIPPRLGHIDAACVSVLFLGATIAGCGGADRVPLRPAEGLVRVDGAPASGVQVRLHPIDAQPELAALIPFAVTDADGRFVVGTYETGDGAPEGKYVVTLFWPDRPPGPQPPIDRLGGAFADVSRSDLKTAIPAENGQIPTFDVHSRPASAPRPARKPGRRNDSDGVE